MRTTYYRPGLKHPGFLAGLAVLAVVLMIAAGFVIYQGVKGPDGPTKADYIPVTDPAEVIGRVKKDDLIKFAGVLELEKYDAAKNDATYTWKLFTGKTAPTILVYIKGHSEKTLSYGLYYVKIDGQIDDYTVLGEVQPPPA